MKDEVALSGAERLLRSRMKVRGVLWIETRWKSQVSQQQQTIQLLLRALLAAIELPCPVGPFGNFSLVCSIIAEASSFDDDGGGGFGTSGSKFGGARWRGSCMTLYDGNFGGEYEDLLCSDLQLSRRMLLDGLWLGGGWVRLMLE